MKTFAIIVALVSFTTAAVAAPSPQVPNCIFDPVKGEYMCPRVVLPPLCKFDPIKGEYVCPPTLAAEPATFAKTGSTLLDTTTLKRGQEGLSKCTREHHGSVCGGDEWKLTHRCATDQQCDMKDGSRGCRTRGPSFSC